MPSSDLSPVRPACSRHSPRKKRPNPASAVMPRSTLGAALLPWAVLAVLWQPLDVQGHPQDSGVGEELHEKKPRQPTPRPPEPPREPTPPRAPNLGPLAPEVAILPSGDVPVETLSIEHLERGQKGYGLSVFAGHDPEPFEVEVLGVWRNSKPELSYLLARLSGQDLERSGVLGGMSGSPVYFGGKLVGAVAFSFSFGMDPIAGITPIDAMRALAPTLRPALVRPPGSAKRPSTPTSATVEASPAAARVHALGPGAAVPTLTQLAEASLDRSFLDRHLDLLVPEASRGEGRPAMTWTASGFGGQARQLLAERLGDLLPSLPRLASTGGYEPAPASAAGSGTAAVPAGPPADLRPGDAVALVLVQGDMSLASHGTVTDRIGDSILAFGHPVYSLGPVSLPMAASEVVAAIPSVSSSFKVSNAGPVLGVFDQDRETGAHGVIGPRPAMTPISVRLRGIEEREYQMELADTPLFRPTLLALTTMGAINAGSYATGYQGLDLSARFEVEGHEPIHVVQSFDGNQAVTSAAVHLLGVAVYLEMNELGPAPIQAMEVEIHQYEEPRTSTLLGARADRRVVAPGDTVRLHLELQPYRGEIYRRTVETTIPEGLGDGLFYLMLGDGSSMDAVRLAVEKREVRTLEQGLAQLRSFHSNRELHLFGMVGSPGRSLAGESLPGLPAGVRALLGSAGKPLELRITGVEEHDFGSPLDGVARIDFQVRRPLG